MSSCTLPVLHFGGRSESLRKQRPCGSGSCDQHDILLLCRVRMHDLEMANGGMRQAMVAADQEILMVGSWEVPIIRIGSSWQSFDETCYLQRCASIKCAQSNPTGCKHDVVAACNELLAQGDHCGSSAEASEGSTSTRSARQSSRRRVACMQAML